MNLFQLISSKLKIKNDARKTRDKLIHKFVNKLKKQYQFKKYYKYTDEYTLDPKLLYRLNITNITSLTFDWYIDTKFSHIGSVGYEEKGVDYTHDQLDKVLDIYKKYIETVNPEKLV